METLELENPLLTTLPFFVPVPTDSVAFEFGPKHGVLIYSYPEDRRPDSKSDILAFGFITVQENAQLIRITSASSNDFLELTLVRPFPVATLS